MICPLSFKKNNLIKFIIINEFNYNNYKLYKKGYNYGIILKKNVIKILNFIIRNIDISQIHFINLDYYQSFNRLIILQNIVNRFINSGTMFNISMNSNGIKKINLINVPDHSLLHIKNNPLTNPDNVFKSNFEVIKMDWFYLKSYKIENNIKCISFFIKNPEKTFDFLIETLTNNYSLQCVELIFKTKYKIRKNQLLKLKKLESITFFNVNFSLITDFRFTNPTKYISLINCNSFEIISENSVRILIINNCYRYKVKNIYENTVLLINQKNLYKTAHKYTCFVTPNNISFNFDSKYYNKLFVASGFLKYRKNIYSILSNGSNILPFIMTKAGKLSGIMQFGLYWCINNVTLAPFIVNNEIDLNSLAETIYILKKKEIIKPIIVRLDKKDSNKVIKLLQINKMEYIVSKINL